MQTEYLSTYKTTINAKPHEVWNALTNPDWVKKYFFGSQLNTSWTPGSSITWTGEFDGKAYTDKGTILEYNEGSKLAFSYLSSWANLPDLPENYLFVTYQIREVPDGTELVITQSNYDEEKAQHSTQNWASVIDEMKKLL